MSENPRPSRLRGCLGSVLRGVDLARRLVLNALFLFFLLFLWVLAAGDVPPPIPDQAALVVAPRGVVVDQLTGDPAARAFERLFVDELPETLTSDLVLAITSAADDERIPVLVLDLDELLAVDPSKLEDLKAAVDVFKESGKPVWAIADFLNGDRYYLASLADEVSLHPLGAVMVEGYGVYREYYKEGLDRFGVEWNVFRVGEYKSAVEPYLRNDMSKEARESNRQWLGELWDAWIADVSAARGLEPEALEAAIDGFGERLAQSGDAADMALELGLVDHVEHPDAFEKRLAELVGEDDDTGTFVSIGHDDYAASVRWDDWEASGDKVAVVYAKGVILPGHQPPGAVGGQSASELIRQARRDEDTKALVLRVDSGGGSAFASEEIRRELELVREAGKPVVVSMGSYAASGGYWIATSSDEIWASPLTVTGSIGIFGYFPTFQKPLARYLGVHVDGVGTSWLSGVRADRALPEEMRQALQLLIEEGYRDFLERVATARDMTVEDVDKIAGGRVWTGRKAQELGLVDQLGGLDDAVASAAERAGLEEWSVEVLENEVDFYDQLLISLFTGAKALGLRFEGSSASLPRRIARVLERDLELFSRLDDPMGIYAHCLCEVE